MTKQTEKTALKEAKESIAASIAQGNRPDIADILLVDYLKGNKTFGDRVRASWFPLLIVTLAMLFLGIMATQHPPVVSTTGRIQTTVIDLQDLAATPRDAMVLADAAERTQVRIFGAQAVDVDGCTLHLDGAEFRFETAMLQTLLDGVGALRLEATQLPRAPGPSDAEIALVALVSTDLDVESFDVRSATTADGTRTCPDAGSLTLEAQSGKPVQISLPKKVAATLPQLLNIPPFEASETSFTLADPNSARPDCAIASAEFEIVQEVPYIGLRATNSLELPRSACLTLPAGQWRIDIVGLETGRLEVDAYTSTGAVVDIENGSHDEDLKLTYLEVVSADPNVAMIFGAIVFVLTTVWGTAAFIREIVS